MTQKTSYDKILYAFSRISLKMRGIVKYTVEYRKNLLSCMVPRIYKKLMGDTFNFL